LAGLYAIGGRKEEARAEVEEILRISPSFSLDVLKEVAPFKDHAMFDRFVGALREAGLK
jgi:hypothetical protein